MVVDFAQPPVGANRGERRIEIAGDCLAAHPGLHADRGADGRDQFSLAGGSACERGVFGGPAARRVDAATGAARRAGNRKQPAFAQRQTACGATTITSTAHRKEAST